MAHSHSNPLNDTVIEQIGDATNAPSSLEEGNNMITTPQNKNETDETVQVTNEVYDFEEGYHHLPFDSDEEDTPNHDQASDQEEEEPLNNDDLPQANGRPVRRTKQPSLLTFDFNSQDRQWTEVHKAYNAEVIEPLQEEANPQDGGDPIMYFPPPRSAIEMMRTKDSRKRNGWLKALKKELKNIIDNGTLDNTAKLEANEPVTMTMETNKIKLDSHGGLDKLKCRIVVRGDMQKKNAITIEDTYSPSASFRVLKMFLADAARHTCKTYQFDVVGAFLQAKMRSRVFIKLPAIYGQLFPEYAAYCGKPVMLLKAMYGMTLSGKYWYEEFRDWLVSVGFTQSSTCPVLFTRHEPDGSFLRIIFYIDDGLYFATSDGALERFKKELPERFNVVFQGTAHWYLSARIHQDNQNNITMDQARYAKSIVTRYLDGAGVKRINSAHNTILPADFMPTVEDKANTMEESKKLQEAYNIDYASCI